MNIEQTQLKPGEEIYYAGVFYTVAELKAFPHGMMVGIYDEPNSEHVDYLAPESVHKVYPCHSCWNGCPVCNGYGKIVE